MLNNSCYDIHSRLPFDHLFYVHKTISHTPLFLFTNEHQKKVCLGDAGLIIRFKGWTLY